VSGNSNFIDIRLFFELAHETLELFKGVLVLY
jgi:hypothetical protein